MKDCKKNIQINQQRDELKTLNQVIDLLIMGSARDHSSCFTIL